MNKAQATIEYVIILGFAMILAIGAISAFGGLPGMGGSAGQDLDKAYWSTAEIGVDDLRITADGQAAVVVKNNKNSLIEITEYRVGGNVFEDIEGKMLNFGEKYTAHGNVTPGEQGKPFSFQVVALYSPVESELGTFTFTGQKNITGEYQ